MFGCKRGSLISECNSGVEPGGEGLGPKRNCSLFGSSNAQRGQWENCSWQEEFGSSHRCLLGWKCCRVGLLCHYWLFFNQFPRYILAFWAEMGLQAPVPSLFGLVVNWHVQDIPCSFFVFCLHFALFCERILFDLILNSLLSPREESAVVSEDIQK